MSDDYYAILELAPDASQEDVKKAYKRMALKWHPDKNARNRAEAERRFKEIGQAYEVLSNAARRDAYDRRRAGPGRGGFAAAASSDFADFEFHDPADVFREFFRDPWVGWAAAESAEWEALFSRAFATPHHPAQNPTSSSVSTFVSTSVTRDGVTGTETVTKTVIDGGVKTVTVTRNGQVVQQTVTNANEGMQSGSQRQESHDNRRLTSGKGQGKPRKN